MAAVVDSCITASLESLDLLLQSISYALGAWTAIAGHLQRLSILG